MKCYHVDAFADRLFEGNPAAVCVLDQRITDELMQKIAMENNLSETAFAVREGEAYKLRWFTPGGEIDLCGHATLATAFILSNVFEPGQKEFLFDTLSGRLAVKRKGNLYEMDFPAYSMTSVSVSDAMEKAIGHRPVEAWLGRDLVCVLDAEEKVLQACPNQTVVKELDGLLLHITAQSVAFDCVTRSFAPKLNVAEDPVCGSGHCHVVPLWAKKLRKNAITARQLSKRGGTLFCEVREDHVLISGKAVLYSEMEIYVNID